MKLTKVCKAPHGFVNNFEYEGRGFTVTGNYTILIRLLGEAVADLDICDYWWIAFVYDHHVWFLSDIGPEEYSNISTMLSLRDGISDDLFSELQAMLI